MWCNGVQFERMWVMLIADNLFTKDLVRDCVKDCTQTKVDKDEE